MAREDADRARCLDHDPELFSSDHISDIKAAKRVCVPCPVRAACLIDALRNGDTWTVRGGMSRPERMQLKRQAIARRKARQQGVAA